MIRLYFLEFVNSLCRKPTKHGPITRKGLLNRESKAFLPSKIMTENSTATSR